jgi:Domain of unknown function (DUF4384)
MELLERHMLTSLLLLASTAGLVSPTAKQDPPIRVWYSSAGDFAYGDRAKVYARAAESGYMVVLRAGLNGQVRVLSPVDPDGDQHVSGGKKVELKGRGDREAFVAEGTSGQGTVLAAWSKTPFTFNRYVKDGRWDLDALSAEGQRSDDAEAQLMSIVDDMRAPSAHFDYDLAVYTVSAPHYARVLYPYHPYGWPGWGGYSAWWGYPSPLVTRRIIVVQPVRRAGERR